MRVAGAGAFLDPPPAAFVRLTAWREVDVLGVRGVLRIVLAAPAARVDIRCGSVVSGGRFLEEHKCVCVCA